MEKKKFTQENPALDFISKRPTTKEGTKEQAPEVSEQDYQERIKELEALVQRMEEKKEPKTKNVTILMRPRDHKRLKDTAKKQNVSMNVFIETAVEKYIDEIEKENQ